MATISKTVEGVCHRCSMDTEWRITHAHVDYHGIVHCLECTQCGMTVPEFAWRRYQEEGRVVIPV